MPSESRAASVRAPAALAFVCWEHPDGSLVQGPPLPAPQAEALAKAFAYYWPDRAYVVKPLQWPGREPERDQ